MRISIKTHSVEGYASLNDSQTAQMIRDALPITARANTWGKEVYFTIPVDSTLDDDAKEVVEKGELGFWPVGNAFCIFFGRTPASRGSEIRPASAVNPLGFVEGDPEIFDRIRSGETIVIDCAELE